MSTIQLDFFMPERFEMEYITDKGRERPVIVHCAILGSIERFMGVIIEHYAGKFPVWLSPIQAIILPITDRNLGYARKIKSELRKNGIRVELNESQNTLQYKIRDATKNRKIPYIIIVGDKEEEKKTIAIRDRSNKTRYNIKPSEFIKEIKEKIRNRDNPAV